jgi:hypothetical protein
LQFNSGHPLGLWSTTMNVSMVGESGYFGAPGRYLYRYRLLRQQPGGSTQIITSWFRPICTCRRSG